MTGVLQRLTAQAAGRHVSPLRAKIPARFEAQGGAEGFQEVHQQAGPRHAAPQGPISDASRDRVGHSTVAAPPASAPHKSDQSRPSPEPLMSPRAKASGTPGGLGQAEALGQVPQQAPAPLAEDGATPHTAIDPDPPRMDPESRNRFPVPVSGAEAATDRSDAELDVAFEIQAEQRNAPPAPLLQTETVSGAERDPIPAAALDLPRPGVSNAAAQKAAAPEITIHIGRLELRGDAARPERRPAQKPQRKTASLSDYLKGGGQ